MIYYAQDLCTYIIPNCPGFTNERQDALLRIVRIIPHIYRKTGTSIISKLL